jgi:cytoskeletal protein CcmA (bactofilin family)
LLYTCHSVFRKFHKNKKVELSCPYCGHLQNEPATAISSYCRECSEHFRIIKGIATPNPGLRVSGIAEVEEKHPVRKEEPQKARPKQKGKKAAKEKNAAADVKTEESWLVSAEESGEGARPLPRPEKSEEKEEGISAGAFFGLTEKEENESDKPEEGGIGIKAESRDKLSEGSIAALIESQSSPAPAEKGKMPPNFVPPEKRKKLVDANADFKVRCFRCYHTQHVSRFAKSTQCERCSVYISLANYEIKAPKKHSLRTRGDMVIGRRGAMRDCEIACHHLTVNGPIDALVDCSGDAIFRHSGVVRGNLYCRKLVIEKHCVVEFPDGAMCQQAVVGGRLVGNLTCSGTVRISRTGSIEGDLAAIDLELKEGGSISGKKTLNPDISTDLPVKMGFNPSIIG